MDFTKDIRNKLPEGGALKTEFSVNGDLMPVSVSYETQQGQKKEVKMVWTAGGDLIPETGYTADGDFNFPGQKWSF